jgi:hypothetical protein
MLSKNAVAWLVLLSGGVFGLFLAGHRIPHRQAPRQTRLVRYRQAPIPTGNQRQNRTALKRQPMRQSQPAAVTLGMRSRLCYPQQSRKRHHVLIVSDLAN